MHHIGVMEYGSSEQEGGHNSDLRCKQVPARAVHHGDGQKADKAGETSHSGFAPARQPPPQGQQNRPARRNPWCQVVPDFLRGRDTVLQGAGRNQKYRLVAVKGVVIQQGNGESGGQQQG